MPDTDSEIGTVTMNSPTEWTEKHGDGKLTDLDQAYANTFKHYQAGKSQWWKTKQRDFFLGSLFLWISLCRIKLYDVSDGK